MAVPAILFASIVAIVAVRLLVQHLLWRFKVHKIQQEKMRELWDNKEDEAWEKA
jgi:hypothetical protein